MSKQRRICWMGIFLVLLVPVGSLFSLGIKEFQTSIDTLTIENVEIAKLSDGLYRGAYGTKFVSAEVEVRLVGGSVSDIRLLDHKNGRGKAGELVIGHVIEKQSLAVDVITGATASSKVILKALETALLTAPLIDRE